MKILQKMKSRKTKEGFAAGSQAAFWIYRSEIQSMCLTAWKSPGIETGGLLFGAYNGEGMATVSAMTPPSVVAEHEAYNFQEDVQHANECCLYFQDHFGLFPLGRYHSHHELGLNEPSDGDIDTATSWMSRGKFPCFLEIILTTNGKHVQLNPWIYRRPGHPELASVYQMERPSPVRMAAFNSDIYPDQHRNYCFPENQILISGQEEEEAVFHEDESDFRSAIKKLIQELPKEVARQTKVIPEIDLWIIQFPISDVFSAIVAITPAKEFKIIRVLLEKNDDQDPDDVSQLCLSATSLKEIYEVLRKRLVLFNSSVIGSTNAKNPI